MFSKIRSIQWGLALSVIALILSFSAGMYMGTFEDSIRAGWKAAGQTVMNTMYKGDANALNDMLEKAWTCLIRAHLHWGALGAATLAASLVLVPARVPNWYKQASSVLMGLGAILYPIAWLYVANHLTAVGGAAKENIHWLATIGITCLMVGTIATLVSIIISYVKERKSSQEVNTAA